MGKIIRNGVIYSGGGSGSTTTRFVQDTSDENYGWIQYKDENGDWVNWVQTDAGTAWLYHDGRNYGEFSAYKGMISGYTNEGVLDYANISVIEGDNLTVQFDGTSSGAMAVGSAISKLYDLTDYSKFIFEYECSAYASNEYNKIAVFITQAKKTSMTPLAEQVLMTTGTSKSGKVELDIGSIEGEYYIAICLLSNINARGPLSVTLIDPYLE